MLDLSTSFKPCMWKKECGFVLRMFVLVDSVSVVSRNNLIP
jgi:hypothetical protein